MTDTVTTKRIPKILKSSKVYRMMVENHEGIEKGIIFKLTQDEIKMSNIHISDMTDLKRILFVADEWDLDFMPLEVYEYMYIFIFSSVNSIQREENKKEIEKLIKTYNKWKPIKELNLFLTDYSESQFIIMAIERDLTHIVEFLNESNLFFCSLSRKADYYYINAAGYGRLNFIKYMKYKKYYCYGQQEILISAQKGQFECLEHFANDNSISSSIIESVLRDALKMAEDSNHRECKEYIEILLITLADENTTESKEIVYPDGTTVSDVTDQYSNTFIGEDGLTYSNVNSQPDKKPETWNGNFLNFSNNFHVDPKDYPKSTIPIFQTENKPSEKCTDIDELQRRFNKLYENPNQNKLEDPEQTIQANSEKDRNLQLDRLPFESVPKKMPSLEKKPDKLIDKIIDQNMNLYDNPKYKQMIETNSYLPTETVTKNGIVKLPSDRLYDDYEYQDYFHSENFPILDAKNHKTPLDQSKGENMNKLVDNLKSLCEPKDTTTLRYENPFAAELSSLEMYENHFF